MDGGTIPLAPRGVCQLSVRYRTGPSVALRHRMAFHVLAVALYGLCGTFRTRRLCVGHRAADVICRAFQAVSGLSSPGLPRAYAFPLPKGPAHCTAMERNRKCGPFLSLHYIGNHIKCVKFMAFTPTPWNRAHFGSRSSPQPDSSACSLLFP